VVGNKIDVSLQVPVRYLVWLSLMMACLTSGELQANEKLYEYALKQGLIEGVRSVELIRPDLLAVTVDPALSKCAAEPGAARSFQKPEFFTISSSTDRNYLVANHPVGVGQESFERFNRVARGPFMWQTLWWHCYYLQLPKPLASGHNYSIAVLGIDEPLKKQIVFTYDQDQTTSKAFKINQVGYCSKAGKRFAYLGWWAGDRGPVDYGTYTRFEVIDESNGESVLEGPIVARALQDIRFSGEDVYQMDISRLQSGTYHIRVPGFACSETFRIGREGLQQLYYHTMRAFFHQRCGQEFRPPWTEFAKPACHHEVWESGHVLDGSGDIVCLWKDASEPNKPKAGEAKRSFRGGYHDAADFDTFTYHLPATSEALAACEMNSAPFKDGDLNLPESGNGIPDILDEAEWGLSFYIDNQYADGAVPLGRINECDGRKQNIAGDKQAPFPPYGVLPPMRTSTPTFAAVAAQFARCIRPYDPGKAARFTKAAAKAFEYASVRTPEQIWQQFTTEDVPLVRHEKQDRAWEPMLCWAAAELYHTTGDRQYNDYLLEHQTAIRYWNQRDLRCWPYLTCEHPDADQELKGDMLKLLREDAEKYLDNINECPYRMSNGAFIKAGWGSAQGVNHNPLLLRLYFLTKESKYLDAASLNADWHLGCNPAGQTFITNLGYRFPNRPEISWFLYENGPNDMRGKTVPGISIYGIGPALKWYQPPRPVGRSFRDVWGGGAEIWNEFTVHQCLGPAAMTYAVLHALECQRAAIE
jgi:endoglucanase